MDNLIWYDLTDDLINEQRDYSLSFQYDGHYNQKINNFIAKKVIDILKENIFNTPAI